MTTQRIYSVLIRASDAAGNPQRARLVRAPNAAQALRFVAADTLLVEVPSQDELIGLASAGVKVEEVTTKDPQ